MHMKDVSFDASLIISCDTVPFSDQNFVNGKNHLL